MDSIDIVYVISLPERKDRRSHITNVLSRLDIKHDKVHMFDAIKRSPGYIGCALSHVGVLDHAISNRYNNIIVLEDDFNNVVSAEYFESAVDKFISRFDETYDVCLLTANNIRPTLDIDGCDSIRRAVYSKTTAGYIINKRAMQKIRDLFSFCATNLSKDMVYNEVNYEKYAIDVAWTRFQGSKSQFYVMYPPLGTQLDGYSDIEKKNVSYNLKLNRK